MGYRDTSINALLGLILLIAFAVPVVVVVVAVAYLIHAIDSPLTHFLSRLGLPPEDARFFGILCLVSVAFGVRCLWQRLWSNAFLSFVVIAMAAAGWYRVGGVGTNVLVSSAWPFLLLFMIPADRSLRRWESVLIGILAGTGIALNVGLLGVGAGARIVVDCVYLGIFAGMAVQWRRRQNKDQHPDALTPST